MDRYQAVVDNMAEGFVVCEAIRDDGGRLTDYWIRLTNPVYADRAPDGQSHLNRRMSEIRPSTSPGWFSACNRALAGDPVRFEFEDRTSGRWYDVHMMRLSDTEFGQIFIDMTARKRAEQLQAQLFDEMNHRVKNNLAVVSAILDLQARSSSAEVRDHLLKAVDRIRTVGDLYTLLYRKDVSDIIDMASYVDELVARLEKSLSDHSRFSLESHCDAISLPMAQAVNLGLIINELVTNAAKHAFPTGDDGKVQIDLLSTSEGVRLGVADNGVGLGGVGGVGLGQKAGPRSDGLGLRLVHSLAELAGGAVNIADHAGVKVEVLIPAQPSDLAEPRR
jgi:two-component sensor histidine kinase